MNSSERQDAAINMIRYGGSFTEALGETYLKADSENSERLYIAFPELFDRYRRENWGD